MFPAERYFPRASRTVIHVFNACVSKSVDFIFPEIRDSKKILHPEFLLLQKFLLCCYFLLVVPFRIGKDVTTGKYELKSFQPQWILSTYVVSTTVLNNLLAYWCGLYELWKFYLTAEKTLWPFYPLRLTLEGLFPLIWFICFWTRKGRGNLERLLNYSQTLGGPCNGIPEIGLEILAITAISLSAFIYVAGRMCLHLIELTDEQICQAVGKFVIDYRLSVFLYGKMACLKVPECTVIRNKNETRFHFPEVELNWKIANESAWQSSVIYFALPHLCARWGLSYVEQFITVFCLIGAVALNSATKHFLVTASNVVERYAAIPNKRASDRASCLGYLSVEYGNLVKLVNHLNHVWGSLLLMYFIYYFPFTADASFEYIDNEKLPVDTWIRDFARMLGLPITILIAASGTGKLQRFRQILLKTSLELESEMNNLRSSEPAKPFHLQALLRFSLLHRQVTTEDVGLKGHKFFTVTYALTATMAGVLSTYFIVMLQFRFHFDNKITLKEELNKSNPDELIGNCSGYYHCCRDNVTFEMGDLDNIIFYNDTLKSFEE